MSVATDPATKGKVRAELIVDHVQAAIDRMAEQYSKEYKHQDQHGWRYRAYVAD